jgi:hypothetical protein
MKKTKPLEISWKAYTVFQLAALVITTINIVNPMDFYVKEPFETYTGGILGCLYHRAS